MFGALVHCQYSDEYVSGRDDPTADSRIIDGAALMSSGRKLYLLGQSSSAVFPCTQVLLHRSVRNHLLLVLPKEIPTIDMDIAQARRMVVQDRGLLQIWSVNSLRAGTMA